MVVQNYKNITSANSTLHAAHIRTVLESAGIPVLVANSKNGTYLDVMVPVEWVEQAKQMLYPERRSGEIYFVPAR